MTPPVSTTANVTDRMVSGPVRHTSTGSPASLAAALPLACAVHCAVTPFLVLLLPAVAASSAVETGVQAVSVAIGLVATTFSWRRHGTAAVWIPVLLGAMILWISHTGPVQVLPETVMDALGGLLLAGGIFWSSRLAHRKRCSRCRT